MQFLQDGDIYKVIRITGSQDNILGISFHNSSSDTLEVIELSFLEHSSNTIQTSKEEVKLQVLEGLKFINESLGTNYSISKIYFSPFDLGTNRVYVGLIASLIRHYHTGKPFKKK